MHGYIIKIAICLLPVLLFASLAHAQQIPEPVIIGSICPSYDLEGCGIDKKSNNIYFVECTPSLALFFKGYTWNIPWEKSLVFSNFQECQKYCIENSLAQSDIYRYNKCVHANGFEFPHPVFTMNYQETAIGCIADDGIFSCDSQTSYLGCDNVAGCSGKPCIYVPAKSCGRPALGNIFSEPAEMMPSIKKLEKM